MPFSATLRWKTVATPWQACCLRLRGGLSLASRGDVDMWRPLQCSGEFR